MRCDASPTTRTFDTERAGPSPTLAGWPTRASALPTPDLLVDRRHDLVQVADDRVVRLRDHGRVGVGVDREDRLRARHAGPVLDGAADPGCDVQIGRHPAAGLADLLVVRPPAEARHNARDAEGATEEIGELDQVLEAVRAAGAAARPDDDTR